MVPELGGWAAGALLESKLVSVAVVGGKSRKETAVKLLRDAITRL